MNPLLAISLGAQMPSGTTGAPPMEGFASLLGDATLNLQSVPGAPLAASTPATPLGANPLSERDTIDEDLRPQSLPFYFTPQSFGESFEPVKFGGELAGPDGDREADPVVAEARISAGIRAYGSVAQVASPHPIQAPIPVAENLVEKAISRADFAGEQLVKPDAPPIQVDQALETATAVELPEAIVASSEFVKEDAGRKLAAVREKPPLENVLEELKAPAKPVAAQSGSPTKGFGDLMSHQTPMQPSAEGPSVTPSSVESAPAVFTVEQPEPQVEIVRIDGSETDVVRVTLDKDLALEVNSLDDGVEVLLEGRRGAVEPLANIGSDLGQELKEQGYELSDFDTKEREPEEEDPNQQHARRDQKDDAESEQRENRQVVGQGQLLNAIA